MSIVPVPAVFAAAALDGWLKMVVTTSRRCSSSPLALWKARIIATFAQIAPEPPVPVVAEMPPVWVEEVATFYNMYDTKPVGRFKLNVCTNLPCQLRDGYKALHHLEAKLGIKMGETTKDGLFTLQQSECLGACADSPVMLVNDRCMCSFMSNEKLDELVDGLRAAEGKA